MKKRVVIITGGFGVLGTTVASAFLSQGDRVVRVDAAPAPPPPSDQAAQGFFDLPSVDISDPKSARDCIALIDRELGPASVLVNIAGGFIWETLESGDDGNWERMFRTNALTAVNMARAALPMLGHQGSGAVINIGAHAALKAGPGMGPYAASKAAVHSLTESLAEESAGLDVTVNALLPTIIDTPANRAAMPNADRSQWISPTALAEITLFLASQSARAITGALIPVRRGTA